MERITIETVYNIYKSKGKKSTVEFLIEQSQKTACCSSTCTPTLKSFEQSVERLVEKIKKLSKSKTRPKGAEELSNLLKSSYCYPCGDLNKRGTQVTVDECLDLKQTVVNEKVRTQKLVEKLDDAISENKKLDNDLDQKDGKIQKLKLNLKRTAAREVYKDKKIQKLESNVNENCCADKQDRIYELESQLLESENKVKELESDVQFLGDLLEDIDDETRILNIFDVKSRKYSTQFKACVYELLTLNVSASKVSDVVKSVLKLVNREPNQVPATSTVLELNLQRLCLAQKHVGEVFSQSPNTCLLTDETSKFGNKFMGYEAMDSEGKYWVLGLREIETKSANNTLSVLTEILADLDSASKSDSNNVSRDIITHITATMSDRAATEVKFNNLLQTYRKDVLPLAYSNYESFTPDEKASIESLSNYFCGLHALVNYAETAQKCIVELEQRIFDNGIPIFDKSFKKSGEAGTCRLVRVASKAFGEGSGGDQKSGCQGPFRTYSHDFLANHNLKSVPLKSYRGSRFNILFSNAAVVYFLHEQMLGFLQNVGAENRLLRSVLFDLQVHEYVAGLKCLGLISKLITCPLWVVLEDKNISMLDMNRKYLELVLFLEEAVNNTDQFINGELQVFEDYVKKDCIYNHIIKESKYDEVCLGFLKVVLAALCSLCKTLYKEHLPDGKLVNVDQSKVKCAPKTSCFAESIFGQLDHLLRTKPNLKTLAAESCIMFLNNQTLNWLKNKDISEQDTLIKEASKEVKSLKLKYKARIDEIKNNRRIALHEKAQKKENVERERIRKQEQYTNDIISIGLWQTELEVDNMLASFTSVTEKVSAIKTQLKFRKEVLLQKPDEKQVFNVTKSVDGKRKSLSVNELTVNLKSLIKQAIVRDIDNDTNRHILVGKRVRHRYEEVENGEKVMKWYKGRIISQVPSFPSWFNIVYDGDEAVYTYQRLDEELATNDLEILV